MQMRYGFMAKILFDQIGKQVNRIAMGLQESGKLLLSFAVVGKDFCGGKLSILPSASLAMDCAEEHHGFASHHIFTLLMRSYIGDSTDSITQPSSKPRMTVMAGSIMT